MRGKKQKVLLLGVALALVLSGCGASDKSYSSDSYYYGEMNSAEAMDNGGYYDGEIYLEQAGSSSANGSTNSSGESVRAGRKLIRTVRLDVETMEFDELLSYVKDKTTELGGYVESMDIYNGSNYYGYTYSGTGYRNNRNGSLTLRIPKDNLDSFLTVVEGNSNITNRSEQEVDVTLDYVDLDSHKAVLLAEQERLLALMEQAETMDDIIMLESRLSEIRYQIESMESRLRTYDNQIEYSTVYLSITEVVELTVVEPVELTTWERISQGFMDSLENVGMGLKEFFIGFIIAIPYLILVAVFVLIILGIVLLCVKKGQSSHQKKMAEQAKKQEEYLNKMKEAGIPVMIGPDGRPIPPIGPDGRPMQPIGPDGRPIPPIGPDGRPMQPIGPDGRPMQPMEAVGQTTKNEER